MSSTTMAIANEENARKSTGPRTPEGKARVAGNALKHGLASVRVVIAGETSAPGFSTSLKARSTSPQPPLSKTHSPITSPTLSGNSSASPAGKPKSSTQPSKETSPQPCACSEKHPTKPSPVSTATKPKPDALSATATKDLLQMQKLRTSDGKMTLRSLNYIRYTMKTMDLNDEHEFDKTKPLSPALTPETADPAASATV